MSDTGIDWDDALANAPYIPDGMGYLDAWPARAAAYRAAHPGECDIAYGAQDRERLDLFWPDGPPRGVAVFVHGGFWKAFDKSHWSHLAHGARSRGWAVAVPSYTIAPDARVTAMTRQIAMAITVAAARVPGPICLAGHSAGGHLVLRQVCADSTLPCGISERIVRVLSISGVHDLRPIVGTIIGAELSLDTAEAAAESPCLAAPATDAPIIAWCGAEERPEFLRQSALMAEAWAAHGVDIRRVFDAGRHHFDVVDGLEDPKSALMDAFLGAQT